MSVHIPRLSFSSHFSLPLLLIYIEHIILKKPPTKHPAPFKMPSKKKQKMQKDCSNLKLAKTSTVF
jgi:hypothetical protein